MTDPISVLKDYAERAETSFSDEGSDFAQQAATKFPSNQKTSTVRIGRRAAAVFLTVTVGLAGLGGAADAAVPGSPLYNLDRAIESGLETLGLSSPDARLAERTQEAQYLLEANESVAALHTLLGAVRKELPLLSPDAADRHIPSILRIAESASSTESEQDGRSLEGDVLGLEEQIRDSIQDAPDSTPPLNPSHDDVLGLVGDEG